MASSGARATARNSSVLKKPRLSSRKISSTYRMSLLVSDVLAQLVSEAELLGHQIEDLVIIFRLENRLDDLIAPLQRPIRGRARAARLGRAGRRQ